MFKNTLKYQQGGKTTQADQEQLVQLFQAAAENAQVDPQELVQKASELGDNEEAVAQFMQGLQLCAQGDPEGIKFVKSLFQEPAYKKGGKILDFVCKHAKGGYVAGCGCGGSVKKAELGDEIPVTRGSYQSSDYHNNRGNWVPTPKGLAQNYRPYAFGGRNWGFGGKDLQQILVVPGETGIPRRTVRTISGWFNTSIPTERLDTLYEDANGSRRNSEEFKRRVDAELEGVSGERPKKEQGGKVEKAQDGNIVEYYTNKWSNDLNRLKEGWRRFKESAPGKVVTSFMPNPNSETGMLGAAAPIGKIKYIPEGVSGTPRAAEWVKKFGAQNSHLTPHGPRVESEIEGAQKINGLRRYLYGKYYNGK